jgi:hypothetical protein
MHARRLVVAVIATALFVPLTSLTTAAVTPADRATMHPTRAASHAATRAALTASAEYGVHVVSSDGWYTATTLTVVGEVSNDTDLPARHVTVRATAHAADDSVVATGVKAVWLDILDPGEVASFRIDVDLSRPFDTYSVAIEGWSYSFLPANHYFTGTTSAARVDDTTTHVSGSVTNENVDPAAEGFVVATLYASDGTVVGSGVTLIPGTLAAGATAAYALDVEHAQSSTPATVTVVAESTSDPNTGVTFAASPHELGYGTRVTMTGSARPGAAVTIQRYDQPSAGWVSAGVSATAGADGSYSLVAVPAYGTSYRAMSGGIASALALVYVKTAVAMRASTKSTTVGRKVILTGVVKPGGVSSSVRIERKVSGAWKALATGTISSTGAFTVTWTPKAKGSYTVRAWVGGGGDLYPGTSAVITIVVK